MNVAFLLLSLTLVGCQHKPGDGGTEAVLSSKVEEVEPSAPPTNALEVGNIPFYKALFNLSTHPTQVLVKMEANGPWIELTEGLTNTPTYTYTAHMQQLRFQWCEEGWAYALVPA